MTTTTEARAEFTLAGQRITWVCSACHQSIRKGTGHLEADDDAADALYAARSRTIGPNGFVDVAAFLDLPDDVPWLAHHHTCDPRPDESGYWIAIERIDTLRKLIHWAGHLMEKRWIDATDWADLLERIGECA